MHRVDVESASGPVTPVAADLAVDGIDELLRVMLADVGVDDVAGPVLVGDRARVVVRGTTATAGASDLLLWMWGRAPSHPVEVEGDADGLRELLRSATQ